MLERGKRKIQKTQQTARNVRKTYKNKQSKLRTWKLNSRKT